MNVIINRVLIILILTISFISQINSQDIVITIPDKFTVLDLPLPPFPKEIINSIEVINYDSELINDIFVRPILQDSISYIYYPNILNNRLTSNGLLYQVFSLETDFSSIMLSYNPEYSTNNYSISSLISYDSDENLVDAEVTYNEYRFPIDIKVTSNFLDLSLELSLSYYDYTKFWSITPFISQDLSSIYLKYIDDTFIRPTAQFIYDTNNNYWGSFGLGGIDFRVGIATYTDYFFPYLEYTKTLGKSLVGVVTNIDEDRIDYRVVYEYNSRFLAGLGTELLEGYSDFEPYLMFSEDFIFGQREYRISMEELNFSFSFINEHITSIISLEFLNLEFNTFELLISYKVGKK
ncbi:MAG: hypothetical protein OCD02_08785 [Spirochaetaceae bacterium]